MQLRHLRYFVTLARMRHFARAAEACGVSQPTLSSGLVALEQEFGRRLIDRDRRFVGLTPHGEAMLPWAQQILGAMGAMTAAVAETPLEGPFTLAAIPAALPLVGRFGAALLAANPDLVLSVRSSTSRAIEQALSALEIDAAITYLDPEPPAGMKGVPLATEDYLFLTRRGSRFDDLNAITWDDAVAQDLCLLDETMLYRRMLDRTLAARGHVVRPRATADSHVALFALVASGAFCAIVPDSYAHLLAGLEWARFLPLDPPEAVRRVGLLVLDRDPALPRARAALAAARAFMIDGIYQPLPLSI
ncbi:LysR family transcriptional regulator [Novosphingobium sp. FSW06-99]|nr:LysR family transcriptional regulator [Novosphingobium sp. FSW06-99]KUR76834.1 LysR family transcriptional regulator [Novosphingobium sp. FSW06-99]